MACGLCRYLPGIVESSLAVVSPCLSSLLSPLSPSGAHQQGVTTLRVVMPTVEPIHAEGDRETLLLGSCKEG